MCNQDQPSEESLRGEIARLNNVIQSLIKRAQSMERHLRSGTRTPPAEVEQPGPDAAAVLRFWFGESTDATVVADQQAALWWSKNPTTDAQIRQRFEALVTAAAAGELASWRGSSGGWLALLILLDQFPRNMYRGTAAAFCHDASARQLCSEGLAAGIDQQLPAIQRVFFYLPLEHAEDPALQARSVALFRQLAAQQPPEHAALFAGFVDYAERHQEIVERFGRFPHRNAVLDRPSTPEEVEFLRQPGSSF